MLVTMELTEQEQAIILERRAKEDHEQATRLFRLKAIEVAAEYIKWSSENGYISPDSGTFVNQFGYEEDDHRIMRNAVQMIWDVVFAWELPRGEHV